MERFILSLNCLFAINCKLRFVEDFPQPIYVLISPSIAGNPYALQLQNTSHFKHVLSLFRLKRQARRRTKNEGLDATFLRISKIDPRVRPSLNHTHRLESGQSLANRPATDIEPVGKVTFRRQSFVRLIATLINE